MDIKLLPELLENVNYSLFINGQKMIRSVKIENGGDDIEGAELRITSNPEIFEPVSLPVDLIPGGKTLEVTGADPLIDAGKLINSTERFTVNIRTFLFLNGAEEAAAQADSTVTVLPFDQWAGTSSCVEYLSAFITPNHPQLAGIISRASDYLSDWTGNGAFDAYQTEDPDRCLKQAAAIFAAIQEQNIIYVTVPPTFDEGQRVRLCDMVLDQKQANCLDMSLLYAACLEAVGLNPILVLFEDHVFAGLWLEDLKLSEPVTDDASAVSKRVAKGVSEMAIVESTMMCSGEQKKEFDDARRLAETKLMSDRVTQIIDVKRCRLSNIAPLPMRIMTDEGYKIQRDETEGDKITSAPSETAQKLTIRTDSLYTDEYSRKTSWERKLLDLGLRNSLINLRLTKSYVPFLVPSLEQFEDFLSDGREFNIHPKPAEFDVAAEDITFESIASVEKVKELLESELANGRVRSSATDAELKQKLKDLYRSAKVSIEENGANTLYIAVGFLKWYESEVSQKARYAPLILIPVEVVRRSISEGYKIRLRDDDAQMNITILEKLKQDFGIIIEGLDGDLMEDDHGINVKGILSEIRRTIMGQKNWDVINACCLGIFSFSQFVMWNDMKNRAEELQRNDIVRSLMEGKLAWEAEPMEIGDKVDEGDVFLPLSADGSQLFAIKAASEGKSFVLHGPPGTGKSQTITSMIADNLARGKRVLFVAEKMAALEVVYNRLSNIGLQPFCLELHSNKAKKSAVLEQLRIASEITKTTSPEEYKIKTDEIARLREELNGYASALHKTQECGMSLYEMVDMYQENIGAPDIGLADDALLDTLDRTKISNATLLAEKLASSMKIAGSVADSQLKAVTDTTYSQKIRSLLDENTAKIKSGLEGLDKAARPLCEGEPTFDDINRISSDIEDKKAHKAASDKIRSDLSARWKDSFFDLDAKMILDELAKAKLKWALPKMLAENAVIKSLKQHSKSSVNKVSLENDLQLQMKYKEESSLASSLDDKMTSFESAYAEYRSASENYAELLKVRGPEGTSTISSEMDTYDQILASKGALKEWIGFNSAAKELDDIGFNSVTNAARSGLPADQVKGALLRQIAYSLAVRTIDNEPALSSFSGIMFDDKVSQFTRLDKEVMELTKKEIYCRLASNVPNFTKEAAQSSELGILQRAIRSGGRGVSIRKLIKDIQTLLPRLCPCMLMSPLSAAQYLDPSLELFDMVVFDEASQIPTCKAVGALARGKTAVIVGDPKQMPPTSFFMAEQTDEEHLDEEDLESILDDCLALSMPETHLLWHYRSRHESLITFSNRKFYDNRLYTFPSVNDRESKVTFVPVDGIFERGKNRTNRAEAEAVIGEIRRRCHDGELSKRSVGVVTFNINQQNLIDDLLQEACKDDQELEKWAYDSEEPLFIKNLENVQGDERDIILFSVGYGPDEEGNIYMNFGPLNRDGGWRRLNVAVSRARYEMKVFSTLTPEMINLSRSSAEGVAALKSFLEFAQGREIPVTENTLFSTDSMRSSVADEIARRLREAGYETVRSVGRSEYKIDIGVIDQEDPEKYRLGILLDGIPYRNSRTARDRDISQISVLQGLGWTLHRVWTMDWWDDPDKEINKIIEILTRAPEPDPDPEPPKDNPEETEQETAQAEETDKTEGATEASSVSEYEQYKTAGLPALDLGGSKPSDNRALIGDLLSKVIEAEAPVSRSVAVKRIAEATGLQKNTRSLNEQVGICKDQLRLKVTKEGEKEFFWTENSDPQKYDSFRVTVNKEREITDIPKEEIANAVIQVIGDQISLSHQDLIKEGAKALGFMRLGTKVSEAMENAISYADSSGRIHKGPNGNWIL